MKKGNIKISDEVIEKIKLLPFFNNKHLDITRYEKLGYTSGILNRHDQYGTGEALANNVEWDWTNIFLPEGWKDVGLQFDRAYTGYCIPPHRDHFEVYKKKFPHESNDIKRRMVFLEDWKSGHYFQANQEVFIKWKQGDWVEFCSEDIHFGGNLGPSTRYTLQVTGAETSI